MPYATQKIAINDPFLDRRVKLIPCQKERIVTLHAQGRSIRSLARMFHVSKRLIQFTVFPERLEIAHSYDKMRKQPSNGIKVKNLEAHRKYKQTLKSILLNGKNRNQKTERKDGGKTEAL